MDDRVVFDDDDGGGGSSTTRGLMGFARASRAEEDGGSGRRGSNNSRDSFIKRISANWNVGGSSGRGGGMDLAKYNIDIEADDEPAENPFEEAAMEARMQYERHENRNRVLKQGLLCAAISLLLTLTIGVLASTFRANNNSQQSQPVQSESSTSSTDSQASSQADTFQGGTSGLSAEDLTASDGTFIPSLPPAELDTWCNASSMDISQCYSACVEAQCCMNKKLPDIVGDVELLVSSSEGANQAPSSCFVHKYKDICERYVSCLNLFEVQSTMTSGIIEIPPTSSSSATTTTIGSSTSWSSSSVSFPTKSLTEVCTDPNQHDDCEQFCLKGACCYDGSCTSDLHEEVCKEYEACWQEEFVLDLMSMVGVTPSSSATAEETTTSPEEDASLSFDEVVASFDEVLIGAEAAMKCSDDTYLSTSDGLEKCFKACHPYECCFHPELHGAHGGGDGSSCSEDFEKYNPCHDYLYCNNVFQLYKQENTSSDSISGFDGMSSPEDKSSIAGVGNTSDSTSGQPNLSNLEKNGSIPPPQPGVVLPDEDYLTLPTGTVNDVCSDEHLQTLEGKSECYTLCELRSCCFAHPSESCYSSTTKDWCDEYAICQKVFNDDDEDSNDESSIVSLDLNSSSSSSSNGGDSTSGQPNLTELQPNDNGKGLPAPQPGVVLPDIDYVDIPTKDVNEACSDENIQNIEGKAECEILCELRSCCFTHPSESCYSSTTKDWCDEYAICHKVFNDDDDEEDTSFSSSESSNTDKGGNGGDSTSGQPNLTELQPNNDGKGLPAPQPGVVLPDIDYVDIPTKDVNEACSDENIQTLEGKAECEILCELRSCCFTHPSESCYSSTTKDWCDEYAICHKIFNDDDDEEDTSFSSSDSSNTDKGGNGGDSTSGQPNLKELQPNDDGKGLPAPQPGVVLPDIDYVDIPTKDVNDACSDESIQNLEGKAECEILCELRSCCFTHPSESCYSSTTKDWCDEYAICHKVFNDDEDEDSGTSAIDSSNTSFDESSTSNTGEGGNGGVSTSGQPNLMELQPNDDGKGLPAPQPGVVLPDIDYVDIPTKDVNDACSDENIQNIEGKAECEILCDLRSCCFTHPSESCYSTTTKDWCDEYAICHKVFNDDDEEEDAATATTTNDMDTSSSEGFTEEQEVEVDVEGSSSSILEFLGDALKTGDYYKEEQEDNSQENTTTEEGEDTEEEAQVEEGSAEATSSVFHVLHKDPNDNAADQGEEKPHFEDGSSAFGDLLKTNSP